MDNSIRIIYLPTTLFFKINNLSQFFLFLGILLKLGGYGMIRILFLLKTVNIFCFTVLFSLFGGSVLSVVCLINRDIKVLIAYSSVVHISLIISNLFSKNF